MERPSSWAVTAACVTAIALAVGVTPLTAAPQRAEPADPAAVAERARRAMASDRFDEAAALYEELLGAYPNEAGLHMNLGMARAMAGDRAAARPSLARAVELDPSLLPAQLFLGIVSLELGRPGEAVAPLERVLAAEPGHVQALHALGEANVMLERFEEAATRYDALTDAVPGSAGAWAGLGRSYEGAARASFAALQETAADSPYVALVLADVLVVDRKLPEAFALYREAQAELPDLPGIHDAVAEVYEQAGHAEWAAAERRRAAERAPDCTAPTAACAFLAGSYDEAVRLTDGATDAEARYWRTRAFNELATRAFGQLEELPASVELHAVRARIAEDQNRPLEAVAELGAALELAPGDPGLERELAAVLYQARDHEALLPLAEKLLEAQPDAPDLLFLYGSALAETHELDRAIPALTRAVEADGSVPEARAALGRALMLKGDAAAALPHLEAAAPGDEDGSIHYQLAQAYQRTNRAEEARAALERYQAIQRQAAEEREVVSSPLSITAPDH